MKKNIMTAIRLTLVCLVFFCGIYTMSIWGIAQMVPGQGKGFTITENGKKYHVNVSQRFTSDKYFWSRPSAVGYNAASSGGSNKGPTNPEYLAVVQCRIDTFLKHNPTVKRSDIPSDLVTASASGIDPHLSIKAANVQVMRIAHARSIPAVELKRLIAKNTEHQLLGIFGPEQINVLKLNLELDRWQSKKMKHSAQL